ncbi:CehA/McbA family metallohydrolase [Clostridium sp. B9]|uniref:CehA/McbA family metallohydrolase n=1 Tax=Clostridium sp. B9 TaxID=3423224 RepID=UPI003D2F3886
MRKNYKVLLTKALALSMVGGLFSAYPVLGAENNNELAEDLIISEYLHGPSNSKAIEIYNGTGESVNLSEYDLAIYSNGNYSGSPVSQGLNDSIVNHGETFVVYNIQGNDENFNLKINGIENKLGVSSQPLGFNGDDVVLLRRNNGSEYEIIDSFGAKTIKGSKFYTSKSISAQRKGEIKDGEKNIDNTPFDINVQWDSEVTNLYDDLGKHDISWDGGETLPPSEEIISIGDAREKNLGEEVTVKGVVSYNDRNSTLHIQDETGAIAISNFDSKIDLSEATKGNEIEVSGVLDNYNSLLQIQATKIKVLEDKGMPNPKVVTIKELNEQNFDSHYVEIKNAIVNIEEKTLTQGNDVLDIYYIPSDINVETGDLVNVKGVVGRFRGNVQLYGASSEFTEIVDDKEAPVITHEALTKANLNENLVIEAMVSDNHKVSEVSIYYKSVNEVEFKKIIATENDGKYLATINKEELDSLGLNYYIEASDGLNTSRVPVEGVFTVEIVDEDLNGPEVINVYPSENSSIGENRTPIISGAFKDAAGVDVSSVLIKVNGQDVTLDSKITEEGFTFEVKEALDDGEHRVEVSLRDNLGNAASKEWRFRVGKLNHYYGQLHSHTNISDGTGSLNDAYEWAKNQGNADYFAVTDHSNWFDNDTSANINDGSMSKAWTEAQAISDNYNIDGEFVSMYGYEMTWSGSTGGWGHINTFNTPGFETRKNSDMNLKAYYDTISKLPQSVSQLNHPGKTFGDFGDFGFYSEGADNVVNLIEVGNGEGPIRGSGYFPSYEYYTRALDKGWHVAPTNNQDNHKGKWMTANDARTIIVAEEKTREALYEAMNDRQVYSSEDKNMTIDYSVNGQIMGSNLGEPEKLNFNISINDEDKDDIIKKVSIIANGGVEVASKEFTGNEAEWNFELSPEYTYYYVKVVQADKDIAVTAPVWIGESINVGLNELETDKEMLFVGDTAKLSIAFYNNSSNLLNNIKVEFFVGEVSEENKIGEEVIESLDGNSLKETSVDWIPDRAGEFNIYAKATVNVDGADKIFTKSLKLEVVNEGDVYKVMIDGAHSNQYVTGNYAGKIDAFEKLLMDSGAIPMINMNEITKSSLEDIDLLIVTDPQGTDNPKYNEYKSKFTEEEIKAIDEYVENGGNLIVTTRADYKDGIGEYSNGAQLNPILEAIGTALRVNDDQVADYEKNEGQQYRLMLNNYDSSNYNLVEGLGEEDLFSFYSGASVVLADGETGENVDFLVKGYETTSTDDADKAADNVPVEKGNVNVLGAEELSNGSKVIVGGSTFFSNFEIDDTNAQTKSNKEVVQNIIDWILPEKEAEKISIKDFRVDENGDGVPDKLGEKYVLEGIVTSQSEAIEPKNAFFEVIYIQDETGGVNVFGVSNTPVKVGQKVRVKGTVQAYQGEFEIEISDEDSDIEIIDETINEVETKKLSTGDSMLHENEGWLTEVKGTVVDMDESNLYIDDGSGVSRVYVEGYIWDGINEDMKGKWNPNIKIGDTVSAIGLGSEDPEGNRLRVRNTGEIVLHEEEEIIVSPVKEFKASEINKKNVTVTWKSPENTTGLEGYILYKDGKKVMEVNASNLEYTFKGLNRHTIYNFKIAAKYSNGKISSKESITLRTKR